MSLYATIFIGALLIIMIFGMYFHFNFKFKNIDEHYHTIIAIFAKAVEKQNEILETMIKDRKRK